MLMVSCIILKDIFIMSHLVCMADNRIGVLYVNNNNKIQVLTVYVTSCIYKCCESDKTLHFFIFLFFR